MADEFVQYKVELPGYGSVPAIQYCGGDKDMAWNAFHANAQARVSAVTVTDHVIKAVPFVHKQCITRDTEIVQIIVVDDKKLWDVFFAEQR